jgi:two-component system, chemotaxis family, sensor histidine kinase and response regulator PixL
MNDSQIQAQAYSYFLVEAPELLQTIEQDILTLPIEHTTVKVHNLMRALHTLKGAAANVGLTTIASIAHDLEDVTRVFYNLELEIDVSIQSLLLEGYSGLQECINAQLSGVDVGENELRERVATTIEQLKFKLGDWMQVEVSLPNSIELGFDIVESIFETTIQEQIDTLSTTIETGTLTEIETCLQATTEICIGLAESFELPGFLAINRAIVAAIADYPDRLAEIAPLALLNLQQAQTKVLAGDRTLGGHIAPDLATFGTSENGAQLEQLEQIDSFDRDAELLDLSELAQNLSPEIDLPPLLEFERGLVTLAGEEELPGFRAFLIGDKFRKRQELSSDTQDLFDRLIRLCWDWFRYHLDTPVADLNLELLVTAEGLADLDYLDRWIGLLLAGVSSPSDRIGLQLYRQSCLYQVVFAVAKYLEDTHSQITPEFLTQLRSKLQTTVAAYKQQLPVRIDERAWIDRISLPHHWTNSAPTNDGDRLVDLARLQAILIESHERSISSQQQLQAVYSTNQTPELAELVTGSQQLSQDLAIALKTISELNLGGDKLSNI